MSTRPLICASRRLFLYFHCALSFLPLHQHQLNYTPVINNIQQKRRPPDVLNLSVLRLYLLSYTVELVRVLLPVLLLLLLFVHAITSGIVCTVSRNNSLCHLFIFKIIPNKKKTHIAIEMIIAILVPINTYRIAQFHIFTNMRTNANTIATKRSRPAITYE